MKASMNCSGGLPPDHARAFTNQAGASYTAVKQAAPGVARYITNLEYGYALHELAFALLFLAVVLVPFHRRERWAWAVCWATVIASVGYSLTFGTHDATVMRYRLVTDIGIRCCCSRRRPSSPSRPVAARRWPPNTTGRGSSLMDSDAGGSPRRLARIAGPCTWSTSSAAPSPSPSFPPC